MMVIIIGKNRAEICSIRKKDLGKPFFVTRNQWYKIYPDGLIPIDIYHDGAFIRSESVTVFEENGTCPIHTLYPEQYSDDVLFMNMDEHNAMRNKKGFFASVNTKGLKNNLPWIVCGIALLYAFISQWVGA